MTGGKILTLPALVAVILSALVLCGCVYDRRHLVDEPIGNKQVERIKPGQTSIEEVLRRLGPPTAIARSGRSVIVPLSGQGSLDMQPDVYFELFSPRRSLRADEVVYYFDSSQVNNKGGGFYLFFINFSENTVRLEVERLWLLVGERSGIIEDYVYRAADRATAESDRSGAR